MEEYHLSADSGGSKIKAVLYDNEFRPVSKAFTGSIRGNSTPAPLIRQHLDEMMAQLFDGHPEVQYISTIRGSFSREIVNEVKKRCTVEDTGVRGDGEGELGLASAGMDAPGLVCLSGTGATMYYLGSDGKRNAGMGGYGAVVFDEGSGYHIGRMACAAAIRCFEGRGEKTLLEPLICEFFGQTRLNMAIFSGVYHPDRAPVAAVASLCPLVSTAAWRGDTVALEILKSAGERLGDQMNALIRREEIPQEVPMTVTGSTYRGHPILFDTLCAKVHSESPERPIVRPIFEPVIGGIVRHLQSSGRKFDDEMREKFLKLYPEYIFRIGEPPVQK